MYSPGNYIQYLIKNHSEKEEKNIYVLPRWCSGKESASVRDVGAFPESGRSPGEGNGNPLQSACLENPMDRGAWRAAVRGVPQS